MSCKLPLTKYQGDKIKDEMGRAFGTLGERKYISSKNLSESGHMKG